MAAVSKDLLAIRNRLRMALPLTKVSLSIEGRAVKSLVTKGRRVVGWGSSAFEGEPIRDGLIEDPAEVAFKVKEIFDFQGISPRKVVASLTGLHALPRMATLPKMPRRLLREAVSREFHRIAPVSLDKLYLSWQTLRATEDDLHLYILGVPQSYLDAQIQTLREAGTDAHVMDLKPLALARAVNRPHALIIDVQPDDFDIVLVVNGVPVVSRTVLFPWERSSVEEDMRRVVGEFLRTVRFFENANPPLDSQTPLFLTGDTELHPTLQEVVERELEYPVTPLEPPLTCPPDFPIAEFAVNIGLAVKELPVPWGRRDASDFRPVDLNILPPAYRRTRRVDKRLLWAAGILAGLAVLVPLYRVNLDVYRENSILKAELSRASQEVHLKALETRQLGEIRVAIDEAVATSEALETEHQVIYDKAIPFKEPLQVVTDSLVPGVRLSHVRETAREIVLSGEADNYSAALRYAQALTETERFESADIGSVTGGADGVGFGIKVVKKPETWSVP